MSHQSMHRRTVKKGVEYDVVSRAARRVLCFLQRPGATSYWKNQLTRRERRAAKEATRHDPSI